MSPDRQDAASRSATGSALASPTIRREALERDVNLDEVRGSGDRGRITKDDVVRASGRSTGEAAPVVTTRDSAPPPPPASPPATPARAASPNAAQLAQAINRGGGFVPPVPGVGYGAFKVPPYRPEEGDQVVPFTRRRRITADHMTYSKVVSPHVVTVAEVDLHGRQLRDEHKDRYKKEGHPLTMLAFVAVATARALRENPQLNARVLDDALVVLRDINLGVAVDSPDGLVVPVIRRADELGVRGIVRSVDDLAKRARTGKITIDDLSGASFSVTNPGIKGNLFGGAIINQPNAGILRMGEIQKRRRRRRRGGRRGPDGDSPGHVRRAELRPPHRRRRGGQLVPLARDGAPREGGLRGLRLRGSSDYFTITIVCSFSATSAPVSVQSSRNSVT